MDKPMLHLAQYIDQHPLRSEKNTVKINYLQALEFFQRRSKEELWANAVLALYMQKFGVNKGYTYNEAKIANAIRATEKVRIKGFKLLTYRFLLVGDILLMNNAVDRTKAEQVLEDLLPFFSRRYHKKLVQFVDALYTCANDDIGFSKAEHMVCRWKANVMFQSQPTRSILIVANVSAGKSTLINALIGKRVNRMQNQVCTTKLQYTYNKPVEDDLTYKLDDRLELDADMDILMTDSACNTDTVIRVGTFFRTAMPTTHRLSIVDTPGVNSALNASHTKITQAAINAQHYDRLAIVLNAVYMGTDDERHLLSFIQQNVPNNKVIFVINQLDRAKVSEDSIADTVMNAKEDLIKMGFTNPCICPVSAYAAMLVKKKLFGESLNADEEDALRVYRRLFNCKGYNLSAYYPESATEATCIAEGKPSDWTELLAYTGIIGLEHVIFD